MTDPRLTEEQLAYIHEQAQETPHYREAGFIRDLLQDRRALVAELEAAQQNAQDWASEAGALHSELKDTERERDRWKRLAESAAVETRLD